MNPSNPKRFEEAPEKENKLRALVRKFLRKRKGEPEQPGDPYARVTAPKKPKPSPRNAAAVAEPTEE